MTTSSVDPAGQHQLPLETMLKGGPKNTEYWNNRFPQFDVPFDEQILPKPLRPGALWLIAAGSDLLLQCEKIQRGAATKDDYVIRAYDSSGNPLNVLGQFQDPASALAALPTLMTIAHMLFPNHLLMSREARHPGGCAAGQVGDEPRQP